MTLNQGAQYSLTCEECVRRHHNILPVYDRSCMGSLQASVALIHLSLDILNNMIDMKDFESKSNKTIIQNSYILRINLTLNMTCATIYNYK